MKIFLKLLQKGKLEGFISSFSDKYQVYVPGKKNGFVTYEEFNIKKYHYFDCSNFDIPPAKAFFYPERIRKYLEFPFDDRWLDKGKKVLFGVRPCDAQSLALLDMAVHDSDLYKEKRDSILIVTMGCNSPRNSCFCTSVKGGPFSPEGSDIFMTDTGDSFVVEGVSGRGAEYLDRLSLAGRDDLKRKEKVTAAASKKIETFFDFSGMPERLEHLDKKSDESGIWRRLGEHCSNCARCTSVCPTCHCCFVVEDVVDVVCGEIGKKAETYDPCMLNIILSKGLTREVPLGHQRIQRRVMDKFCRTMKTVGQPFCVGCGRCIINCLENIDLIEIFKAVIDGADCQNRVF